MEAPADPVVGEVVTRGPHVMLGYWGDTSATARVLSPDGWFHTGDLGWLDAQGRLWLAGRSKDMVKTGGENVLAAEVERVLLTHPGVTAAAVVGVPHARLGEQVG
jgi:acyl-activating enzyme 14